MTEIPIGQAGSQLDELVRRAADGETIALTDDEGVTALLVSAQVVAGLEDSLAAADCRRRKAEGTLGPGIPHAEAGRRLGLRP
ncbi:type II toxin-antitoxin system prevent-host-death family antitoxin [Streptomyces sp. NPDC047042]|uniref:type II toxin-antitoxin system prevent-host-death family antitoxin n=1 Tax=Streptomyces sp. NPDC047042 TaxID=3154807 RepID=UPI0033FB5B0C